jgi:hypothetical protein
MIGDFDLRYARRMPNSTWTMSTVDTAGNAGKHVSIAVDVAGGVHIAYHATTQTVQNVRELRHAYLAPPCP